MFIITKNAEQELYKCLHQGREDIPFMRCLYLRFSGIGQKNSDWLSNFLSAFEAFLEERVFHVFICADGDVVILTKTLTARRLEHFLTHLTPELVPVSLKELAQLFEVGEDWKIIDGFVNEKLEQTKENIMSFKPVPERLGTLTSVSQDDIATLKTRRSIRDHIQILVVEDDLFSQRLIQSVLSEFFTLCFADDGNEAVKQYVQKAPDVVFLDIGLPDISGHNVLKEIFLIDEDAYVVMFSGQTHKENILKAIEIGARGFFGKPFTKEKLMQYIERSPHIHNKRRIKSNGNSTR